MASGMAHTGALLSLTIWAALAVNDQCLPTYDCSVTQSCYSWPYPTTCVGSSCVPPTCYQQDIPCPANQYCNQSYSCVDYPALLAPCPDYYCAPGSYCSGGVCKLYCDSQNATSCPAGTTCENGYCLFNHPGPGCGENATHIARCAVGSNCTGTDLQISNFQGTCLPFRPRGCQCTNDYQCLSKACYQNICLDTGLKVGQACFRDGQCASNNCTKGVCVGFDCSICGNLECESYYKICHPWCNYQSGERYSPQQNKCVIPGGLGAPCSSADYASCQSPLSCYSPSGYGGNGTCQPYYYGNAPSGASCESNYACQSQLCRNNLCTNDFTNIPCTSSYPDCPNTHYCSLVTGFCAPYIEGPCTIDDDCGYSNGSYARCLCTAVGVSACEKRGGGGGGSSGSSKSGSDYVFPPQYALCGQVIGDNSSQTTLLSSTDIQTCRNEIQTLFLSEGDGYSIDAFGALSQTCAQYYALAFCCLDCIGQAEPQFIFQSPLYPTTGLNCATLSFTPSATGTYCDVPTELQNFQNARTTRCNSLVQYGFPLILSRTQTPTPAPVPTPPTPTPAPVPTAPTPTRAPVPTAAPVPTPSPTSSPTRSPVPTASPVPTVPTPFPTLSPTNAPTKVQSFAIRASPAFVLGAVLAIFL